MKYLLLLFFLLLSPLRADQFSQRQLAIETFVSPQTNGQIKAGCRQVTFIFSSAFAGTIQGAAFSGATDVSFNINAQSQDTVGDIYFTITAGSMRVVELK